MPSRLIPIFPLQVVVFPRTNLPLHIFEERYKEMTGKAMRENSEFGIVLAKEEGIVNAGCTVMVQKLMHTYPDGRMDIMTRGRNRFEIAELNDEQSYLQAEVEFFDDDDEVPAPPELRHRALENFKALLEMGGATGTRRELGRPRSSVFNSRRPCPISTFSMLCCAIARRPSASSS